MITTEDLVSYLVKNRKVKFYSGVPCSILKGFIDYIASNKGIRYFPAVRENLALGLASGAYLAGKKSCVIMQNSGLGNVVNALTSFNLLYRIPVLMFITWRGFEGKDAPEHSIMGNKMIPILEELDIPYRVLSEDYRKDISWAIETMETKSVPVSIIIKKGILK